jgi:hypothetical protein
MDTSKTQTGGFVTYLRDPDLHTNRAYTHPGYGLTREESQADALYYANQAPWVVTVPWSRAPLSVRRYLDFGCAGDDPGTQVRP